MDEKGQPDRSKINMSEDYEVKYWPKTLGVTREQLQKAIDKVGNSADRRPQGIMRLASLFGLCRDIPRISEDRLYGPVALAA
jgi:Protein of unknown function (DUF3606)